MMLMSVGILPQDPLSISPASPNYRMAMAQVERMEMERMEKKTNSH